MSNCSLNVSISVGDSAVAIRRGSSVTVANILGTEGDEEGKPEIIYLDRLVHSPDESEFTEWYVEGAVVSVLKRKAKQ